jgi:hypothetical protein
MKKSQAEMSAEIAAFTAKRKEALERAEKLREERKALQRQREVVNFSTSMIPLEICLKANSCLLLY